MNNLVWFTNNLRVQDNRPLYEACKQPGTTIAVYCFDPRHFAQTSYGFKKTEKYRAQFLIETVQELRKNLALHNITLLTYIGKPEFVLEQITAEYSITKVFYQQEWTSEEQDIINRLQTAKSLLHIQWKPYYDQFLWHPDAIPFQDLNTLPQVFTVFRKECEKVVQVDALLTVPQQPASNSIPNPTEVPDLATLGFASFITHPQSVFPFKGGESQALQRIEDYFTISRNLSKYKETRNGLVGTDYSSKLSAWLANGSVSARTIYWKVKEYETTIEANESTYWLIFELIWRDYFKYISLKFGNKIFHLHGILDKKYDWNNNSKAFNQWTTGTTHEPFVNANMIELKSTGFMSNRGRQNVASFWAKEWHQDWRIGAAYFESMLIDYDVHSNYGNWLYNAGVGNDPRDRIFNIKKQANMYDPKEVFVNLWVQG